jgi:hypothetical protein
VIRLSALAAALALVGLVACGGESDPPTGPTTSGSGGATSTAVGSGGAGAGGASGSGGGVSALDDLLARLRADRDGTLLAESRVHGWPVLVDEGRVVVSTDPAMNEVAGDFDAWAGTPLAADQGFAWAVVPDTDGAKYKLKSGATFTSDPWSRSYDYDQYGEISVVHATGKRFDRFFEITAASTGLEPRTVRVLVPAEPPTHVLYVHDGQNLFDPDAPWGGWDLASAAPAAMMIVGIDNTAARMDEYTQVADEISGQTVGGLGDQYADLVEDAVRPLVADVYGEPPIVGVMGSSLGGLISLHEGYRYPDRYDFVASMSGTLGWGSIGPVHTGETMIERYDAAGVLPFVVYLDSGGDGPCADSDGDGIQDDGAGTDNYCETIQMRDTMAADGWVFDQNLFHWHEPGATHDEAAWAARVYHPLEIFAAL